MSSFKRHPLYRMGEFGLLPKCSTAKIVTHTALGGTITVLSLSAGLVEITGYSIDDGPIIPVSKCLLIPDVKPSQSVSSYLGELARWILENDVDQQFYGPTDVKFYRRCHACARPVCKHDHHYSTYTVFLDEKEESE